MALSHWNRGSKHLTFCKCPTTQTFATEWLCEFNLEELCPVLWWLHPVEKEELCPDDHHGTLKLWCLIQSVPWGNRGEKPVISKGPFPWRTSLNIQGGLWHLCKKEVAPDTPKEAWAYLERKCVIWLCSLGEWTVWQFSSARGRGFYCDTIALVLDSLHKVC